VEARLRTVRTGENVAPEFVPKKIWICHPAMTIIPVFSPGCFTVRNLAFHRRHGILLSFTFGMIIGGFPVIFPARRTPSHAPVRLIMSIPALYLIISLRATFPPGMSSAPIYAMIIII